MYILGISAFFHDSAAAIIYNGKVIAAAQEERFTRLKNDASFPINAVRFCLEYAGCSAKDLQAVAFYDKPFLKFERLLETYYAYAPSGWRSFLTAMPVWIDEKLFIKKLIKESIRAAGHMDWRHTKLLFPEHHLSHAASAFYPSGLQKAAILTVDGVGEWATLSICLGEGKGIKVLKELHFPHSLGLLYSAFTYYCGFEVNSGEYKLMGLAPFGDPGGIQTKKFTHIIREHLVDIREDGSFFLHQDWFTYATGLRMVNDRKWQRLFGFPKREKEEPLLQAHADLALAVQLITEEILLKLARHAKELTQADHLCMAGGVALNGTATGKILEEKIFDQVFVQPASGDAGGALGAAYAAHHIYYDQPRTVEGEGQQHELNGCYLGPEFSDREILTLTRKHKNSFRVINDEDALVGEVAQLLADGQVVGWFQGRTEFGPRALGSRSIFADAGNVHMQSKLNMAIKFRESFRPFAPIVPVEEAGEYFEHEGPSPYMTFIRFLQEKFRQDVPPDYQAWDIHTKQSFKKSNLPGITHVDFSARLQTVDKNTNVRVWKLLYAFKKYTGRPVLINTSFNVKDEPIVNTPEDAFRCFMQTGIDYLVAGNIIFSKKLV